MKYILLLLRSKLKSNFKLYSDTFNRVQDMYLKAARLQPSLDLDPDVQTGLGVLLNLSGDFDKVYSFISL